MSNQHLYIRMLVYIHQVLRCTMYQADQLIVPVARLPRIGSLYRLNAWTALNGVLQTQRPAPRETAQVQGVLNVSMASL
jgi:hypothetical protein